MRQTINIADLKARLSEFVELAESGQEVVVCRRNLPVARLVAYTESTEPKRLSDIVGWLEDDSFSQSLDRRREQAAGLRRSDPFSDS
jgi:prevent-host-death family protein